MRFKPTINLGRIERGRSCASKLRGESGFFFLLILTFLLSCLYRSRASARDPTSLFFRPAKGYERRYSAKREQEAAIFISSANRSVENLGSAPDPLFCIAVSTSARNDSQCVRNTVGSLLEGLSKDQRRSIFLTVLIAELQPEEHAVYHELWLRNLADSVIRYEVSDGESERLRALVRDQKTMEKAAFDYEYLLHECMKSGAQWIMTVEDDVLAVAGWYNRAKSSLDAIAKHTSNDRHWLYLRLFYTETLMGWNRENWLTYLIWSCLSFVVLVASLVGGRTCSARLRKSLNNLRVAFICCAYLPSTILLYFAAGKVSMHPLPLGLQRMENFACCAQGFVYPRKILPLVIERLRATNGGSEPIDVRLERWADEEHWARYALVPPLLQNVGFDQGHDIPDVWNFAFENYR